jgi:hypothetical protein
MTGKEFEILTHDKVQQWVEANLDQDPSVLALQPIDNEIPAPLVLTQLKYLQKAQDKLPTYYNSRCLLPPRAFEQSSSEAAAALKIYEGKHCLDLTMGLGVDSLHFSRHFEQVTALEANPVLSEISAYNFQKLRASNVNILSQTAESFLKGYEGPAFDLIYVDPSRRDAQGKRLMDPEKWQPRLSEILPLMKQHGKTLLLKLSPMFDWEAAWKRMPGVREVRILSIDNECKELLLELDGLEKSSATPVLSVEMIRQNQQQIHRFDLPLSPPPEPAMPALSLPKLAKEGPLYLYEPDVAFYKGRLVPYVAQALEQGDLFWDQTDGYLFSTTFLPDFPGRKMRLYEAFPFKPKAIKKTFQQRKLKRANISRRVFSTSIHELRQRFHLEDGGDVFLFFTTFLGKKWCFYTKEA